MIIRLWTEGLFATGTNFPVQESGVSLVAIWIVVWFLIYGGVLTDPGSISWLAVQWVESNVEFIPGSAGLDLPLYIYDPMLLSTLALLSVSQGLSACSPSVASSFCVDQLLHSQQSRTMAQQQQIRYEPALSNPPAWYSMYSM